MVKNEKPTKFAMLIIDSEVVRVNFINGLYKLKKEMNKEFVGW